MDDQSAGETRELTAYWTQAQPTVASFIASLIPNFQDADDVLQSVAMVIVRKFDQYDRNSSFLAWAMGIARNEVLSYRRRSARDRHVLDDEALRRIADIHETEALNLAEIKKALEYCIGKVQGRWRQILEMRYLRELKPSRIAQQLGMSTNALFVTLHRIRAALRDCIQHQLAAQEANS